MGGQTPLPRQRPDVAGTRVGRFTLLDHFVSGAASDVWVAVKQGARGIYLFKQLAPELLTDTHAVRRLQREAAIAFRLDHPSFTRMVDAGEEGGRFCIATELVAGQSAAVVVHRAIERQRPVPLDVTLAVVTAVLDGLGHLHDLCDEDGVPLGIVHRDLNPNQVIVGFAGEVKIIDFGALQSRGNADDTTPGMSLGSPEAIAPEQAEGAAVDRRADLHAAGVLAYQLLTGRNPFVGSSVLDTIDRVRTVVPNPITAARPDVPRAFSDAVARALHKEPALRYADAAEMRHALVEAAGVRPASKDTIARYMTALLPEELGRMRELIARGQQIVDATQEFVTEESIQQGAYTRTGVPMPRSNSAESQVRTAVVRMRGDELAPVIPLPLRPGALAPLNPMPSAFTPSVMEMPGTAVVRVSGTQLVRDTRALRNEVERWRARFIAAVAAGAAGMLVMGAIVAVWVLDRAPDGDALPQPTVVAADAPAAVGAAAAVVADDGAPNPGVIEAGAIEATAGPSPAAASPVARPTHRPTKAASPLPSPRETAAAARAASPPPSAPPPAASPTASAAPAAPVDPVAALRRAFTKLQDKPRDTAAIDALIAQVRAAATSLPEPDQRYILSDLNATERSYDLEPLGAAISKLSRARRAQP